MRGENRMDIKKPMSFKTTDRAHADLFNKVVDQLNENDQLIVNYIDEIDQKQQQKRAGFTCERRHTAYYRT